METQEKVERFNVGGRTYEPVPFLKKGESCVSGDVMVERAEELGANLGEEDGQFILEHQNEIPQEFRGKFYLVFTAWRNPSSSRCVNYLYWNGDRWYLSRDWRWLERDWYARDRLVRRVS